MSFNSYLIQKFDHTHENQFFRDFSDKLDVAFAEEEGEHNLIGNISVDGHSIDAIFIASGQITIIDFKDYEGEVTFSENNPWKLTAPDGELVFVQGGAKNRNPFQQVNAYRYALAGFLENNKGKIVEGPNSGFEWIHTNCIVLFQRSIKFDKASLPAKISRFFQVQDFGGIINALKDQHSKGLEFSGNQIRNILRTLDVRDENLLKNHKDLNKEPEKDTTVSAEKLAFIKQLIFGAKSDPEYSRVINYYRTLVNVERFKTPKADQLFPFPLDTNQDLINYKINISASNEFHQVFLKNRQERFPKNIFIGLQINLDGHSYPLLHTIKVNSDINDVDNLKVKLNTFSLYTYALEKKGLGEDILEELITAINDKDTIDQKLEVIREILSVSAEMTSTLLVGLSTESLFSSQLLSELRKLNEIQEEDIENELFKNFVLNEPIEDNEPNLELNPLIQITPLNPSQEKAVKMAFKMPLTVITGPPGTGKSQVVMNMLANSIVNGHKVLFASKNNKAIESVKDRIDAILNEPYLLRFGSKDEINNNAKPLLENFLTRKSQGEFHEVNEELFSIKDEINSDLKRISSLQKEIDRIPNLQKKIEHLTIGVETLISEKEIWLGSLNESYRKIFIDDALELNVDLNEVNYTWHQVNKWKSNFFQRFIFNWFYKNPLIKQLRQYNHQPELIYEEVQLNAAWVQPDKSILESAAENLEFLSELKKSSSKIKKLSEEKQLEIDSMEALVASKKEELGNLLINKETYQSEILQLKSEQPTKGVRLLNIAIDAKLSNLSSGSVQRFNDYLPVTVWRDDDIEDLKNVTIDFLKEFHAICLTSLSVKNSFPLKEDIFDLLVIDEASQCDIASVLPMLYRTKRVVIIGDDLQLTHISSIQKFEEEYVKDVLDLKKYQLNYKEKSLYDYSFGLANKSNLESVFLEEHYRCHPEIINFSNEHFYKRKRGQEMKIRTSAENFHFGDLGVKWIHVDGEMHVSKNLNMAEVNRCIDLALQLSAKNPDASIGIVTPFRDQYETIFSRLPDNKKEHIQVDTVHKYQGDEKDIMIFSTVVTDNSPAGKARFINTNDYLINVAVTRARSSLYIVGNLNYCSKTWDNYGKHKAPLALLADYTVKIN
jgi:superfamily I DNA and/or RNA helicase